LTGPAKGGAPAHDAQSPPGPPRCLDSAPCRDDDMLDDRKAEPGSSRGSSAVASVEALEDSGQLIFLDTSSVVADLEHARPGGEGERRARPRVTDRVLGEVLDDGLQHPPPEGKLDPGRGVNMDSDVGVLRAVG